MIWQGARKMFSSFWIQETAEPLTWSQKSSEPCTIVLLSRLHQCNMISWRYCLDHFLDRMHHKFQCEWLHIMSRAHWSIGALGNEFMTFLLLIKSSVYDIHPFSYGGTWDLAEWSQHWPWDHAEERVAMSSGVWDIAIGRGLHWRHLKSIGLLVVWTNPASWIDLFVSYMVTWWVQIASKTSISFNISSQVFWLHTLRLPTERGSPIYTLRVTTSLTWSPTTPSKKYICYKHLPVL